MISPFEIEEKEFTKQVMGYSKNEVDEFLYKVSNDIENLLKVIESKEKEVLRIEGELEKFNRIEKNITEALVVAKETSNEIINSAKQKSKNIIKENEINAKNIIDRANSDVMDAKREFENLKKSMNIYRIKMNAMINTQLELNNSIVIDEI
ncbi:DivIVA domain-containing protein [Clostridiaceae bacterium HSG29]|nr:DivIVA domain-containing protein [Clostridiaceae bacterium HSG29]